MSRIHFANQRPEWLAKVNKEEGYLSWQVIFIQIQTILKSQAVVRRLNLLEETFGSREESHFQQAGKGIEILAECKQV